MTGREIIERVDELCPNDYEEEQKLRWLSSLDGQIFHEVISTHEDAERDSFEPYEDGEETLLVPWPYGEDLYCWYLQAMIAAVNAEAYKFQQLCALYNGALQQYTARYNREHLPKGGRRFRF